MGDWKCYGELCDTINYEKGDEWLRLLAEFDKKQRTLQFHKEGGKVTEHQ